MKQFGWKIALASLTALGASGCMSMGGYGSYGSNGYYDDGYGASGYAYNDRCYDAYGGYYDYYTDYDCYDRDDYRNGFSVNIGFGGGWWNDYYYPGYGTYMFDRRGARRQLYGNYLRYWGGRRAGYNWQHRGGSGGHDRDGWRNRDGHRDDHRDGRRGDRRGAQSGGVGDQIIDSVRRTQRRQGDATDGNRTRGPEARRPMIERIERTQAAPVARADRRERRVDRRIERVAPQPQRAAPPAPVARPKVREAPPVARSNDARSARGAARVESKKRSETKRDD